MSTMVSPDVRSMDEFEFDIPCVNDDHPAAFMGKGCADDCYHPVCGACVDYQRSRFPMPIICVTCLRASVRFEDHISVVPI